MIDGIGVLTGPLTFYQLVSANNLYLTIVMIVVERVDSWRFTVGNGLEDGADDGWRSSRCWQGDGGAWWPCRARPFAPSELRG